MSCALIGSLRCAGWVRRDLGWPPSSVALRTRSARATEASRRMANGQRFAPPRLSLSLRFCRRCSTTPGVVLTASVVRAGAQTGPGSGAPE